MGGGGGGAHFSGGGHAGAAYGGHAGGYGGYRGGSYGGYHGGYGGMAATTMAAWRLLRRLARRLGMLRMGVGLGRPGARPVLRNPAPLLRYLH